jgi:septin family protein
MASDATTSPEDGPLVAVERPRSETVRYAIERQILCDRIEQLERELAQERRQRQQIVEQYERLLQEKEAAIQSEAGLLDGLF